MPGILYILANIRCDSVGQAEENTRSAALFNTLVVSTGGLAGETEFIRMRPLVCRSKRHSRFMMAWVLIVWRIYNKNIKLHACIFAFIGVLLLMMGFAPSPITVAPINKYQQSTL